jgi:hypothetical protein
MLLAAPAYAPTIQARSIHIDLTALERSGQKRDPMVIYPYCHAVYDRSTLDRGKI